MLRCDVPVRFGVWCYKGKEEDQGPVPESSFLAMEGSEVLSYHKKSP